MKFTQRLSLRVRLTLIFLILASVTWLLSSFVAWKQTTDNVDELFDTQLMLFAKRLSTLDLNEINAADRMAQTPNKLKHGHVDDDALTFAIFTHDGRMVLNDGDNGEDIPYSYQREGFADGQLVGDKDQWRFVWMTSPDGKYRIVVGQEWEYREDMALAIVAGQLIPWLVALPIMLIIMMVLLGRELAPLNKLALALRMRDPDSEKPLNATGVPSEVRPLVESLNQLFARTHAMMVRERRFTSDAAHELRSPLTALKVQTEVAQLSDDDPQARKKALLQLHSGIDRATRLVDQLLTLSRLDSLDNLQDVAEIPLEDLLQSSVMDIYHTAQQAKIDVRLTL
ncbi:TPA: two-component system sensor histidine kinase QseC, partial [Escherichia coli]|nr:two-component system sensor histidine kinase QseC [Escherichia coli]